MEESGQDGYSEARNKKLQEIQEKQAMEQRIKILLGQTLEPDAQERLARIKIANPALHETIVQQIAYYAQSGKLREKVTDEVLKQLAFQLSQKKETRIEFKRK